MWRLSMDNRCTIRPPYKWSSAPIGSAALGSCVLYNWCGEYVAIWAAVRYASSMGENVRVTGTCARCGRPIWSVRALATGYGEGCRRLVYRAARVLEAQPGRQAAAAALALRDAAVLPHTHPGVVRVCSSDGSTVYLSHRAGCTCKAGLHARVCWHRLVPVALAA